MATKTQETEAIFSSTGRPDVSERPFKRLYANGRYCDDPDQFVANFMRLSAVGERHDKVSRIVARGLVSEAVMRHITGNSLHEYVEVAFPVTEFTGDDSWFVSLAKNKPRRESIVSYEETIRETEVRKPSTVSPLERVRLMKEQGYYFIDQIGSDQVEELYNLWGDTFGWTKPQVDALRRRLIAGQATEPFLRDVWFAAVADQTGTILSAGMAEKLSLPAAVGQLDLVESTEWRTKKGYEGRGLMTATLAVLNAQILDDFKNNPNGLPLIFGECNFQSRSDRAGCNVGFRIPGRIKSAQILVQNVQVQDDKPVEKGELMDFVFVYLPTEAIRMYYNPSQIKTIKRLAI